MVDILEALSNIDSDFLVIIIILILVIEVFLLSFPKEIVMVYAGLIFGTFGGGLINLLGRVGAFWLGYETGLSGRFGFEKLRKKPIMQKYEIWLGKHSLISLMILRLIPLTPNDILSISAGFARLKRRPYLLVSFIGSIPYAFIWAYVGTVAFYWFAQLTSVIYDPSTWIITFAIVVIVGLVIVKMGTDDSSQTSS
jgi:uncharacterized membrane protein YdjX (TVP38/TMEM64 family)